MNELVYFVFRVLSFRASAPVVEGGGSIANDKGMNLFEKMQFVAGKKRRQTNECSDPLPLGPRREVRTRP
ncbi:MAG: hypothetical protein K2K83_01750, partial [Rikenella sp.]|nr:hypothetical protein [Rikenella sp.]